MDLPANASALASGADGDPIGAARRSRNALAALPPGHTAHVVARGAALARRGYFELEELHTMGHIGGRLQGHPDRLKTPGVDMTTGMEGHGISVGVGLGLAARLKKLNYPVYVLLGDGERQ